ncbi:MAG: glycosyltransferase [Clostridia bacterium]|nr:glycosyltransferase [Clostridia bacterium]
MSILISVVMPVFNGETFLRDSLDSVLGQSIRDIEVICVDDGSTDASLDILNEYAEKDRRVVVLRQINQGSGPARNLALQHAKGKYAAFLDSDDFYPNENTLALLYQKAEENGVLICGGTFSHFRDRMLSTEYHPSVARGYVFHQEGLIHYRDYQFDYGYHRFIYNLDFLRKNNLSFPDLRRFQDVPFFVDAMIAAGSFYAVPDITYCYREKRREKPCDWASVKFRDYLKGVLTNLRTAKKHGYEKLYLSTWQHFCARDFQKALAFSLRRHNYPTLEIADAILRELDLGLLQAAGEKEPTWVGSLQEGIHRCLSKYKALLERVSAIEPNEQPAVTVVMPSLNVEPFIRLCVESAMRQTMKNIEILCIDAGSTDGTLEALQEYAAADKRIRIIHSDKKSYGYQVNTGISQARGKYVAILETDDFIAENMYETLYEKAETHGLEVVKGDACIFRGDGIAMEKDPQPILVEAQYYGKILTGEDMLDIQPHLLYRSMYIWAGLYNTAFLREKKIFCQETPGASYQDNGFWFLLLMRVKRMMFIHKTFYYLRRDNPNSSVVARNKQWCMKAEYDYIRAAAEELPEGETKQKFIRFCAYYRYINYIFTYNIIAETEKLDFLQKMQAEFLQLEKSGELDMAIFSENGRRHLAKIMDDPLFFYVDSSAWVREAARSPKPAAQPKVVRVPVSAPRYTGKSRIKRLLQKVGYGLISCAQLGYKNTLRKTAAFFKRKLKEIFRK